MLGIAVPHGPRWVDWHGDPDKIATGAAAWVLGAFEFDIRQGQYWFDGFGPKPSDVNDAVQVAAEVIASWPRLIPIYGHRFMPSSPEGPGNPVLSVYQASDSIYYGNDFADYLHREFGIGRPSWSADAPRTVPEWSSALGL